ncbi:MAG: hypothetical protein SFX73_02925 [Kofleriaceae bacterium]|nr:hypothetical protein [Kofleriaceae bacterium]
MKTSLAISTLLVAACATSELELELDREAVEAGADDGKADSANGLVRLERATVAEVAAFVAERRGGQLADCFDAYRRELDPAATYLTKAVANKFISVDDEACAEWSDLQEATNGVLDARGVTRALPEDVIDGIAAWATTRIQPAAVSGFVSPKKISVSFYDELSTVQDQNAMAREKNPTGVSLAGLRDKWDAVQSRTTLDREFYNPVTFAAGALDGDQVFRNLRAAFPLRNLALESSGTRAITDFAAANEGPEGDPAFAPIATALRKTSIRKRFYFAGGGEGWSSNVLIVVDQHGQAWGMQMGYSE